MKSTKAKLVAVTLIAAAGTVAWSPPNNEDITVGSGNSIASDGGGFAVIGQNNTGNARHTIIAGTDNSLQGSGASNVKSSVITGINNVIGAASAQGNLVAGYANTVTANGSLVTGALNTVRGSVPGTHTSWSVAIGHANLVTGDLAYAIGSNNEVSATHGVALGNYLSASNPFSVAVGNWNAPMAAGDVMVVGTGGSESTRNTAFKITGDGSVILGRAQGDISMGSYQ